MNTVFADTSYFLAFLIPGDLYHRIALQWSQEIYLSVVTSDYVLLEVANFLSSTPSRRLVARFWRTLETNFHITMIPGSPALMASGLEMYDARPDQSWSLTDCLSFVIMHDRAIRDALTADHHFEQAGFNILLKDR